MLNKDESGEKKGLKQKLNQAAEEEQLGEKEKKFKVDEEAKKLGMLLASKFGLAEVAGQPRGA